MVVRIDSLSCIMFSEDITYLWYVPKEELPELPELIKILLGEE